jgi:hypothetical protein
MTFVLHRLDGGAVRRLGDVLFLGVLAETP